MAETGDDSQLIEKGRPVPTGDMMGNQAATMDNQEEAEATVGREEEGRDSMYVDGDDGVENLVLLELGVGHVSCLLDLFLLDHGPGLRYIHLQEHSYIDIERCRCMCMYTCPILLCMCIVDGIAELFLPT